MNAFNEMLTLLALLCTNLNHVRVIPSHNTLLACSQDTLQLACGYLYKKMNLLQSNGSTTCLRVSVANDYWFVRYSTLGELLGT